jgi:RimJ/RimL family protein N-acetyltransferase
MKTPWLPTTGPIPQGFETARLRVRPLTIHDLVKDYDAVMSSRAELRGVFPGSDWPRDDLTLEQDLIDLAWHQKEFQSHGSYAYTVVSPDESQVLGCIYLYPPSDPTTQADLLWWVRTSELGTGLKEHLREALQRWISDAWGLTRVVA